MKKLIIISIFVILPLQLWSQQTIGVLDISAKQGVSEMEADIVTDFVYDALYSYSNEKYDIISRQNREAILDEHKFSLSGLCDDTKCAIEVGRYLSADFVIIGTFTKFGSKYYLSLQMVDVNTTVVTGSSRNGANNLDVIAESVVDKCVSEILKVNIQTARINTETPTPNSTSNEPISSFTNTYWTGLISCSSHPHDAYRGTFFIYPDRFEFIAKTKYGGLFDSKNGSPSDLKIVMKFSDISSITEAFLEPDAVVITTRRGAYKFGGGEEYLGTSLDKTPLGKNYLEKLKNYTRN